MLRVSGKLLLPYCISVLVSCDVFVRLDASEDPK